MTTNRISWLSLPKLTRCFNLIIVMWRLLISVRAFMITIHDWSVITLEPPRGTRVPCIVAARMSRGTFNSWSIVSWILMEGSLSRRRSRTLWRMLAMLVPRSKKEQADNQFSSLEQISCDIQLALARNFYDKLADALVCYFFWNCNCLSLVSNSG